MAAPGGSITALVSSLTDVRQQNSAHVAAIALLVYDLCLTFSQEVEHIWSEAWTIAKCLYIIARYYAPIHLAITFAVDTRLGLTVAFCKQYFLFWGIGPILYTTLLNIIFVMRIHAIYNRSVRILALLIFLLVGEFCTELAITIISTKDTMATTFVLPPVLQWPGCLSGAPTTMALLGWVPTLCVALIFFILTAMKFIHLVQVQSSGEKFSFKNFKIFSPFFMAFFRDGTIYFLLIFSILLVCTCISLTIKTPLASVGFPWLVATYSFSATRLVLNVRAASKRDMRIHSEGEESITLVPIAFDSRRMSGV